MKIEKIDMKKQRSRRWSGGEAFDVYCYPEGSTYEDWNFDFNVSTAICEDLDSKFTPMEDTERTLMILGGIMEITHPGRYTKFMRPYVDVDHFMGDWGTISKGRCNDFNLLCRNGYSGDLIAFSMLHDEEKEMRVDSKFLGIFTVDASLVVKAGNEEVEIAPRELVVLEDADRVIVKTKNQPTNFIFIPISE